MNAYLFTAHVVEWRKIPSVTRSGTTDQFQSVELCTSSILFDDTASQAQKRFEAGLRAPSAQGEPNEKKITRIVAAQIVPQLFMEFGSQPLDWPHIYRELEATVRATAEDDSEQGYWVDVNELVRPGKPSASIESLKQELPEDISSGLNWSPDKEWYFLLSVLSPPPPPPDPDAEMEVEGDKFDEEEEDFEMTAPSQTSFPQLADKEAAAVIRARNSVVAAWLWRRFAADTRLATNAILIEPLCWAEGYPKASGE